jgi:hypothetical protein
LVYQTTKPKAYLYWILLDEQLNPVPGPNGSGFDPVGTNLEYKTHVFFNMPIVKSGYLYAESADKNSSACG